MKHKKVQHIPKGIKIIKVEDNQIILKYRVINLPMLFLYSMTCLAFIYFGIAFLVLYFLMEQKINSYDTYSILAFVMAILFYIASHSWCKIVATEETIKINNKPYDRKFCNKIRCHQHNKRYFVTLPYGVKEISLPYMRTNGLDVINYINYIISTVNINKRTDTTSLEEGVREQNF